MKKFIKILINQKNSSGFTLVELMVAMLITSFVISATGFGLVTITNRDKREKAETERRVELNRALDFIADEVRQAKPIATDADADLDKVAPGFNPSDKTPVLTLQIPDVKQRVIYYIASPPSDSVWLGPKVIYRWGPNFNNNGQYTNADNAPPTGCSSYSACNPQNWQGEPLADLIVNSTPSSNPNCDTGWTANPAVASRTGFYACVDPSGRIADIHLRGKLTDAYGNTIKDNTGNDLPLEVSSKVFARPGNSPFTLGVGSSNSGGNGGTVTITQPSTVYIDVLGGDVACSSSASPIPTKTKINFTPQGASTPEITELSPPAKLFNKPVGAGTTLTVNGILEVGATNNSCNISGNYNSATHNGTQVLTLRNGDSVPNFPPFGTGRTIDSYLTKYLDPGTRTVKLADNQVIFLYELDATNSSLSSYDLQDLVVLATIVPNSN